MLTTPMNTKFSKQLPAPFSVDVRSLPKPTEDVNVLKSDLARYGYCLVANAIAEGHLVQVQARLREQAAAEDEAGLSTRDGGTTKNALIGQRGYDDERRKDDFAEQPNQKVHLLVNKGEAFRDLVTLPKISALVSDLLNHKWILSSLWANIVRPGGQPMAMHCDQGGAMPRYHSRAAAMANGGKVPKGFRGADAYSFEGSPINWPAAPFSQDQLIKSLQEATLPDMLPPPIVCQVIYFVSDVTPENGGTCVIPGESFTSASHKTSIERSHISFSCTRTCMTYL